MARRMTAAAMSIALGLGGCAGTPTWVVLESRRFTVETNQDGERAADVVQKLELEYAAIEQAIFPRTVPPKDKVRVVLFDRAAELRAIDDRRSSVRVTFNPVADIDGRATMTFAGDLTLARQIDVRYAIAMRLVRHHLRLAPEWVRLGLVQVLATLRSSDSALELGKPLPYWGVHYESGDIRCWGFLPEYGRQCSVPSSFICPLAELNQMSSRRFYGLDPESDERVDEKYVALANGMSAWAWVHFFLTGPERYQSSFIEYLALLTSGIPQERAWTNTLDTLDPDQLVDALHDHHRKKFLPTQTRPFRAPPDPKLETRTMSPVERDVALATLADWETPDGRTIARARLRDALAADPRSTRALTTRGWLAYMEGDASTARRLLDDALRLAPQDLHALVARAEIDLDGLEHSMTASTTVLLEQLVPRMRKAAFSSRALDDVARYYAYRHEARAGLSFARRSLESEPSCTRCWDTYARLLYDAHLYLEAVGAQRIAINLMPASRNRTDYELRLEAYERAASLPSTP